MPKKSGAKFQSRDAYLRHALREAASAVAELRRLLGVIPDPKQSQSVPAATLEDRLAGVGRLLSESLSAVHGAEFLVIAEVHAKDPGRTMEPAR